jgi:hypothetical protein
LSGKADWQRGFREQDLEVVALNTPSLQGTKEERECAADSMPRFILLLGRDGCVLRANHTVERGSGT